MISNLRERRRIAGAPDLPVQKIQYLSLPFSENHFCHPAIGRDPVRVRAARAPLLGPGPPSSVLFVGRNHGACFCRIGVILAVKPLQIGCHLAQHLE